MQVAIGELKEHVKTMMGKVEASMNHDFGAVRTGKANPSMLDPVMVEYYGSMVKLRDVANIATPEPRLLTIQPYETKMVPVIEKAVIAANLGIMPVSDGRILRLPIPELSQERRQTLVKQVKARVEEAKVAARNVRRDANDVAKKANKDGDLTEDEYKQLLDELQKLTDKCIANIDKMFADKEKELMTV